MTVEQSSQNAPKAQKKKFRFPHVYTLLSALIVFAFVMTFVIPSGTFERVVDEATKRTVVQNGSFHLIEKKPLSLMDLPMSLVTGLQKSANIIFFVLLIGGAFQIVTKTKVFDALTQMISKKVGDRGTVAIPIIAVFFSILGFTMGASQEVLIFIPIGVAVARTLGFDAITGVAMMQLGAMCGFTAGLFNPFNVGVAQGIAGIELYSGLWLRVVSLVIFLAITIAYMVRYATRVRANPELSFCRDLEIEESGHAAAKFKEVPLTKTHLAVLAVVVAGFALLLWGIRERGWFINEMSAVFFSIGVISGFIGGLKPDEIAEEFVIGARALTFGSLIIGFASAIIVILEKGVILDTIINGIFAAVSWLPTPLQVVGIYLSQIFINFFIISGTGQAAVVMPILVPLGDLLGISRQTLVLAFQMGDGFTNSLFPTASTLMAVLSVAKVRYEQWLKYVLPLMGIFTVVCGIIVYVASIVGYN